MKPPKTIISSTKQENRRISSTKKLQQAHIRRNLHRTQVLWYRSDTATFCLHDHLLVISVRPKFALINGKNHNFIEKMPDMCNPRKKVLLQTYHRILSDMCSSNFLAQYSDNFSSSPSKVRGGLLRGRRTVGWHDFDHPSSTFSLWLMPACAGIISGLGKVRGMVENLWFLTQLRSGYWSRFRPCKSKTRSSRVM